MKARPLHDRVLAGGIIIPDSARVEPQEAEVFAVGPGKANDAGSRSPSGVEKGGRILIGKYSGFEIEEKESAGPSMGAGGMGDMS